MIRDQALLDFLEDHGSAPFEGVVFRAIGTGLPPATPSTTGGRWMLPDAMAVLYTSTEENGALAEISFHLTALTPIPRKPIALHRMEVKAKKAIRITKEDFPALNVDIALFGDRSYTRTQTIGDAVGYLGYDAMIVPSARWDCFNLVLFPTNQDILMAPRVIDTKEVDWFAWAQDQGLIRAT